MARLYDDPRWKCERGVFLAEHRYCVLCTERGIRRRATIVDHTIPHRGDPALFWDQENWQPVCKPCHDGTKQSLERSGRLRGCDEDGMPLDPRHHWRQQRRGDAGGAGEKYPP